jgi:hypothetical protein
MGSPLITLSPIHATRSSTNALRFIHAGESLEIEKLLLPACYRKPVFFAPALMGLVSESGLDDLSLSAILDNGFLVRPDFPFSTSDSPPYIVACRRFICICLGVGGTFRPVMRRDARLSCSLMVNCSLLAVNHKAHKATTFKLDQALVLGL